MSYTSARIKNKQSLSSNTVFASATDAEAVTPSDATLVEYEALYVGGAGNVVIAFDDADSGVTFSSVPAGTILPVAGRRVMAATTATNIVALRWL